MLGMKSIIIILFCIAFISCSSVQESLPRKEIEKQLVVRYDIIDKTECNGFGGDAELFLVITEKYSQKSEVEVYDINEENNLYRKSGSFATKFKYNTSDEKKFQAILLDKDLMNILGKTVGTFVDNFYSVPLDLFDEFLKNYELCGSVEISSFDIAKGVSKSIQNAKGKTKVTIYFEGK